MKIVHAFFILSAAFLLSCSSPNTQNTQTGPVKDSVLQEHHDAGSGAVLTLNNGKKWKADAITNENVGLIQKTAEEFRNQKTKSITDYHSAATKLQQGVDKLLADCKMQGEDHEALHKWVLPLMEKIKKMGDAADEKTAEPAFTEIGEHLDKYKNYFE